MATFVTIGLSLSMVSSSSPLLKTKISTSFANFDFSFPLIYLLLLFHWGTKGWNFLQSVLSFIAFAWQLDDGLLLGFLIRRRIVHTFLLQLFFFQWLCHQDITMSRSLPSHCCFFLTSWPFLDPCNVTHSYMYYSCEKFFFLHIQPLLKNKHKHNMTSIHYMK